MQVFRILLFVFTALTIISLCHLFVLRTFIRAFPLIDEKQTDLLYFIVGLVAFLMPLSMPIVKFFPNFLSRTAFLAAAYWMALFFNLFFLTLFGWLVSQLASLVGREVPTSAVLLLVALLSLGVTAFGLLKAAYPEVRHFTIEMENLPKEWQGKKIVHLSDLHLGHILGNRFMSYVANKVAEQNPALVVVTGDLFDGLGGDFLSYVPAINELKAEKGVFMVVGNHEVYTKESSMALALPKTNLQILDNKIVEIDGLQLFGVGFPGLSGEKGKAVMEYFRANLDKNKPTILLQHLPTSMKQKGNNSAERHNSTYWYPDTNFELNRSLGVDLQLSGHTHAGQFFPFGHLAQKIYGGFDCNLHTLGDFQIFISGGTGTFGPPIRTAGRSEIVVFTLKTKS